MSISPSRVKLLGFAGSAAALFLLTACGGGGGEDKAGASGLDTVTVQLDYQLRGGHGMFYVAQKLGYFQQERIEVESIKRGTGSPDALRTVGTGRADFGFGDLPSLVTARSQGVPVKALAAVNQASPLGMCSLKRNLELSSVASLKGRTVGVHSAGSTFIFYQALLAANKMQRGEMKEFTVTPPFENYLIQGRVDAVPCYIDAEVPQLEEAAGGAGTLSVLLGSDAGYDVYGSGLFAGDEMIKKNPDLVQRFTNAYLKAFTYVLDHPAETAKLLSETAPENASKAGLFQKQLQADIDHTFTSDVTTANGLGAMDEAEWQSTIDVLAGQGVLKGAKPTTKDVYDDTFVKAYGAKN